jgi:hypothetical protein
MLGAMRAPHVFVPEDGRLTGHLHACMLQPSSFRRVSTFACGNKGPFDA